MIEESQANQVEVAIVGAGPVGLLLACRLAQLGLRFAVLEKRPRPYRHTRAIGIHAPGLRMFEALGMAEPLLARGVKVTRGAAYSGGRRLGELSFASCPKPYNFVLTVPQFETERLLEECLVRTHPAALKRNVVIEAIDVRDQEAVIATREPEKGPAKIAARYVVGCDGRDSVVRKRAGIAFPGGPYADTFVMGDFKDATDFGEEARIFLDVHGLVESFPLPGGQRRWVVQTDELKSSPEEADFVRWVRERSGVDLTGRIAEILSPFGVHHHLADAFALNRLILAGDAAHVMSPIGGQGMNIGWLDAWDVAEVLRKILRDGDPPDPALEAYSAAARLRAKRAIQRAERYMSVGRRSPYPTFRNAILRLVLHSPMRGKLANIVTLNAP